jgi:uncharacterized protein (DUF488 family)
MIYTIGHSNHAPETFLDLLGANAITALGDVRSVPHSRWATQFNRDTLSKTLTENGIAYVYLGKELGGRPKNPSLLKNDKPNYAAMAHTDAFREGIARVLEGAKTYRMALMCAERDPIDCHRFLLIARHLAARDIPVAHILANGKVEKHEQTERRYEEPGGTGELFAATITDSPG